MYAHRTAESWDRSPASLVLAVERQFEALRVGSSNLSGSTVTEAELVEAPGREPGGSGFKSHQSPSTGL